MSAALLLKLPTCRKCARRKRVTPCGECATVRPAGICIADLCAACVCRDCPDNPSILGQAGRAEILAARIRRLKGH